MKTHQQAVPDLRLPALKAAYASGTLTPRTLLKQLVARAQALQAQYRAYISLFDEAQLEPWLAALDGRDPASLPLYGVPFAIKDNIDLAGVPTTAACPGYAYTPERSATVVEQLIALGAIPTGKTNLDQFATGLNGQRSPYGGCPNSVLPEYPSGGSSSGSALTVALGLASFALGTDTAGSGRVPAALNDLIGCKPSHGLISAAGIVPACQSLDCVALFTHDASEAGTLLSLLAVDDERDPYSRRNPSWNSAAAYRRPASFRFGVPRANQLEWLGCNEAPLLFEAACKRLEAAGGSAIEIDFAPFLAAARLLYEGPWTAERYSAFGDAIDRNVAGVLPVIRDIVGPAREMTATSLFSAQHRLRELKAICDRSLAELDCVLMPTFARAPTIAELSAEPIRRNSELGLYTNFVNLLDYAAVAAPAGHLRNGLPWGVTVFGRAFTDQSLLAIASLLQERAATSTTTMSDRIPVVVCGAHLDGLPLNHQLRSRGARLLEKTYSAPSYRLYALAGGPPQRPGMVRDEHGRSIEVEVWSVPSAELGSFVAGIPAPLGLGKVELVDGRWETGFICEPSGIVGATDISAYGGWRPWLRAQAGA
jgi:allophanate hydrolase